MKSVTFVAKTSGDGECFLWQGQAESDRAAVVGVEQQVTDRKEEEEFQAEFAKDLPNCAYTPEMIDSKMRQIYPGDVCNVLGVEHDKFYKFTVTVEEVK